MFMLLPAFALLAQAQTPQKVIDDYLRALGDSKTLAQVRTERIEGSLTEESTGATGSWSQIVKAPGSFYRQIIAGTDTTVEAYNGMSAWAQNPGQGALTLTGPAARSAQAEGLYLNGRLTNVKKDKMIVQLTGDASHVHVTLKPGIAREIFFDARSHLIAKEIAQDGTVFEYSDYRPVQGIQTPYRIELHRGGHDYRISVTHVEFNSPVEDSVFAFPAVLGTALPDIPALFREVSRNQKAIEELQKQYTCRLSREDQEVDSQGAIKSVANKEFDVFHIGWQEVLRLVAKDGKPLTGDEKKKEEARFNKQFEELTKKEAELSRDPKKQAKQDAEDEAQISDFLRVERFSNPRRERFRGQDVIAFDFGPNPDFKPKSVMEHVIQSLAGMIWIDERAHDVVRLEARFNNSLKIGAGLVASVEKGTSFVFEQARLNDEVWLPSYAEIHVAGRLLFFKGKVNQINRYSDYRKFHAESKFINTEN